MDRHEIKRQQLTQLTKARSWPSRARQLLELLALNRSVRTCPPERRLSGDEVGRGRIRTRPVVAVHRRLQSGTPHTDTTHSPAAQLRFARLLHVVPDQVLVEHGDGERNIAVRWAVDHSLADDLRAPRAEALVRFF